MPGVQGRLSNFAFEYLRRPARVSGGPHVVGVLFLLGAVLGVVSLVLTHPASGEFEIWIVVVAATIVGILLLIAGSRVPNLMLLAAVAFGSLLINVMALAAGVAAGVYAGMFCWVVLVSVNFFSLRAAVAQFAWMVGTFAVVLTLVESSGGYSALSRWLTTTLALAVTGGAGVWLVFRRRLAEEEAQRFLDLSQEMLCTIGSDGRFAKLNPAWERILGYSIPRLYETPVAEIVHPEDKAETEGALARLWEGTTSLTLENRCRSADGGWRSMVWSVFFAEDETMIYARVRPKRSDPSSVTEDPRPVAAADAPPVGVAR